VTVPEALTPLRDSRFAWYFTGRFVSTVGSTMAPVALTFAVLDITSSATALGQVLAARSVPLVLFLLVGGVVADRLSRTLVMQYSHVLSALTQGIVAGLVITGTAELWMIVVLEALNGIVSAFTFPAMMGVVPQVVPRTHLQQANALLGFTRSGLAIIGPSMAAVLVVTVGAGWALAFDATTWLVAAACLSRVKVPERRLSADAPPPNMVRELKDGWAAFVHHSWVWIVVVAFCFINAIHIGAWFVVGPVVALGTIGETGWGYVLSAEAAGVFLFTIVLLKVSLRFPLRAGMLGSACFAVPLLMIGLDPELVPIVLAAFVAGCGLEVFSIGWSTALHEHVPEEVLSRVSSYDALGSFVAIPIGQLVYGPLAATFGAGSVLTVSAFVYAGIALVTLGSPSVRNLERVARREPSTIP
jgi:hypothetical protein